MGTEADTCRALITPGLQAAGWETEPHSIAEQRTSTDGRIVVHGSQTKRRKGKRADYLLRYTRDFPVALPEQRRIVAELDALQAEVDALKRLQAETAAELVALLPALLDRAFKGEL